jgi:hypothetical protein
MFDLERLQHHVLQAHVVVEGHLRKPARLVRGDCITGRARDAATEEVRNDDEVLARIKRPVRPGQRRLARDMVAAVPSREHYDIIPLGRQGPSFGSHDVGEETGPVAVAWVNFDDGGARIDSCEPDQLG